VQKLRGINKSGEHVTGMDNKVNYLYDYYIQINVSKVNGNALQQLDLASGDEDEFEIL